MATRLSVHRIFNESSAPASLDPDATLITGSVCGVKVQEVEDLPMRQIRYLDKLVDGLAGCTADRTIQRRSRSTTRGDVRAPGYQSSVGAVWCVGVKKEPVS